MLLYWIIEKIDQKRGAVRVLLVEDEPRLAETVRRAWSPRGSSSKSNTTEPTDRPPRLPEISTWCSTSCCPPSVATRRVRTPDGADGWHPVAGSGPPPRDRWPDGPELEPSGIRCAGVSSPPQGRCGHQVRNPCGRCGIRTMR